MKRVEIIRFVNNEPENPELLAAACAYIHERTGESVEQAEKRIRSSMREYAVVERAADGTLVCHGVSGFVQVFDISHFHVDDERDRALLVRRIETILDEMGVAGCMVYVSPDEEAKWQAYLNSRKGEPAHRWLMKVRP